MTLAMALVQLLAEVAPIIVDAIKNKDADLATLQAAALQACQNCVDRLGNLPTVIAANDAEADAEAKK